MLASWLLLNPHDMKNGRLFLSFQTAVILRIHRKKGKKYQPSIFFLNILDISMTSPFQVTL